MNYDKKLDCFRSQDNDGQTGYTGDAPIVELILEKLAAGETVEQLLEAHPRLTKEGIRAALEFAREVLRGDVIYPPPELQHELPGR